MKKARKKRSEAPKIIGEYRLIKKLDAGGMGVVFKAIKKGSNNEVALKALPPKFARNAERLTRFRREVLACSRLNHPNLIRVIEQGCHQGIHYFTMEYFPGLSLKKMVKRDGPFTPERVIKVSRQIAGACSFYHKKRLVHRDIKPSNILLNEKGHVKIIDFGLAKVRDLSSMTRVDQAIGTARYLAPEILLGHQVDRRSDIYQVGLVLHELLTGEPVFPGREPMVALRTFVFGGRPIEQINFKVKDKQWANLLLNCLALDPNLRYDDADDLAKDVERIAAGDHVERIKSSRGTAKIKAQGAKKMPVQKRHPTAKMKKGAPKTESMKRPKTARQPAFRPPNIQAKYLPVAIVLLLGVLAVFAYLARPPKVLDVQFAPGLEDVAVSWRTTKSTPTALECSRMDRNDFERFDHTEEGVDHRIVVRGLQPGQHYRVHIILPSGKRTEQYAFTTEKPIFSDVQFQGPGDGSPRISFRTTPPLICEVEYRTATGMSKVHTGYEPKSRHVVRLPSFDFKALDNEKLRIWYRQSTKGARHRAQISLPR
jgi:serine/threonine protein kinase